MNNTKLICTSKSNGRELQIGNLTTMFGEVCSTLGFSPLANYGEINQMKILAAYELRGGGQLSFEVYVVTRKDGNNRLFSRNRFGKVRKDSFETCAKWALRTNRKSHLGNFRWNITRYGELVFESVFLIDIETRESLENVIVFAIDMGTFAHTSVPWEMLEPHESTRRLGRLNDVAASPNLFRNVFVKPEDREGQISLLETFSIWMKEQGHVVIEIVEDPPLYRKIVGRLFQDLDFVAIINDRYLQEIEISVVLSREHCPRGELALWCKFFSDFPWASKIALTSADQVILRIFHGVHGRNHKAVLDILNELTGSLESAISQIGEITYA